MKKIIGIALSVIILAIGSAKGQSLSESALTFSRTHAAGSARIQAIGGAQIALGGDYSSGLSNPAGLGMYNRSELTITPAINFYKTKADYLGTSTSDNTSKFNVPGISYVKNFPRDDDGDFRGGSFGISFSRINDFNSSVLYRGYNGDNSIVDYFLDQAAGTNISQFNSNNGSQYNTPTGLAFDNFLIGPQSILDPNKPDNQYFTDAPVGSDQQEEIVTKGASNQWSFSYGANFKDMYFVGGGIGLTTLRYKSQKIFSEVYDDQDIIRDLQLVENLDLQGSGINVTIGTIIRPTNFLQAGLSFTSPTYYQITENYDASMSTTWNNYEYFDGDETYTLNNESSRTDIIASDYSLTTPLKLSAGVALLSKFGFLSADIERTNAGKARYSAGDNMQESFTSDNDEVKQNYKAVFNYRIGGEFRYKIFRVRAGYNVQSSPYKDATVDQEITTLSAGVGIRLKKFYTDLTILNRSGDNFYTPYALNDETQPVAKFNNSTTASMITFGFTF